MTKMWIEIECPQCQKTNWVDNGDINDLSYPDIDAFECFNCHTIIDLETEQPALNMRKSRVEGLPESDLFVQQGQESPE